MPGKTQQKNIAARMATLRTLFEVAATQENIRGTAWAGWNAIGEYLDHFGRSNVSLRAANSLSDSGSITKRKTVAYQELLGLAA